MNIIINLATDEEKGSDKLIIASITYENNNHEDCFVFGSGSTVGKALEDLGGVIDMTDKWFSSCDESNSLPYCLEIKDLWEKYWRAGKYV